MRREIALADVIVAWDALDARTDDARAAIARLLDFELRPEHESIAPPPDDPVPDLAPPTPPRARDRDAGGRVDRAGDHATLEATPLPPLVDELPPLPPAIARPRPGRARPAEPLFSPAWSRAIASSLQARRAPLGAIDVDAATRAMAQLEPLRALPRRDRLVSASGIVVYVDSSDALAWFHHDAVELIAKIDAVTRARVEVVTWPGAPSLAATDPRRAADDDGLDERPPSLRVTIGSRVIGITDLGLATVHHRRGSARASAWADLADALRGRGASLAIVTPIDPARIPARLARTAACVPWDRATRPAVIRRLVRGLA